MTKSTSQGYLFAFGAVVIWTGFILVSRIGGTSPLTPYDVIAIRYITCATLLLPIWMVRHRVNLLNPKIIVCSLIGGLAYACCAFRGFELAPASHAAVLLPGLMPLFITTLSKLLFNEPVSKMKWLGVTIVTLGVLSLLNQEVSYQGIGAGQFWLVLAAFSWALFSVLVKRWSISAWEATIGLAVITCMLYLPIYLTALPKNISVALWQDIGIQAVYQGFLATIVQMLLYVRAVHLIGPTSMGTMMSAVPIFASLGAVLLLDESYGLPLLIAAILVSVGSVISQMSVNPLKPNPLFHQPSKTRN